MDSPADVIERALAQSPLVLVLYESPTIGWDDARFVMGSIRGYDGLRMDDQPVSRDDRPMVWVYSSPQLMLAALSDGRVREWLAVSGREVVGFAERFDPTVPALRDQLADLSHQVVRLDALLERRPTQDIAAEQSVLASMLPSRKAIEEVLQVLRTDDFYRPVHRVIFDCIRHLYVSGEPTTAATVAAELERRGGKSDIPYLHTMTTTVPTAVNVDYYTEIVKRAAVERGVHSVERFAAGYHADTDAGADRLGLDADVDMLAELVVSRLVRPPLSIGLFGNWGSGKSFFMRLMRERIRTLADASAAEEVAEKRDVPAYCSSVRQITFNAWHYAEANLWASLATHIFDNLASGTEDDLRRRADDLAARRDAADSLLDQLSLVRLERMTVAARQERLPDALGLTSDDLAWVGRTLGVDDATAADVRQFADEVIGLGTEARQAGTLLRRSGFAWAALGVGVVLTVVLAFVLRGPIGPIITAAVSTLVATTPVIMRVREAVARIRRAATSARAATGQRLAELDAEAERLERAISELAPAHDVTAFAESRRASEDYRQHLGVVSLLRRDLETFAAILDREREAGGLERIVLYVDDLDRCRPEVVVKVLEAIHLLVALPVFVVVVGVDARWLRQAIRRHYAAMLPDDSVTPAHYLEKIFQIPFQLSTMDNEGFAGMVRELVAPREDEPNTIDVVLPRKVLADAADPLDTEQARDQIDQALEQAGISPLPRELRPRQLEIPAEELDFLTRLAPLVPSPRATKRLVNLYRLVRTRLADAELAEAPAVAALLAVHADDATAAHTLLDRIATTELTSWHELTTAGAEDGDVAALCSRLAGIEGLPDDLAIYRRWLPLIRRFSFGR